MAQVIGLAVCGECGAPTKVGDSGLCRECDSPFFTAPVAPPLAPWRCSICRDAGAVETKDGKVVDCSCLKREAVSTWGPLLAAGAPERFAALPAETLYEHRSCYLWGPTSCGKTRRATQAMRAWLEENPGGSLAFAATVELGAERRNVIAAGAGEDPIARLKRARYLVLDDIGKDRLTSFTWDGLWELIDHRYRTGWPIVITSEVSLDALAARLAAKTEHRGGIEPVALVRRLRDIVGSSVLAGPFGMGDSR